SSLGLTQLARIAAWLTPQTIPGLDTLSLMGAQLVRPWPESALPVLNIGALGPLLWPLTTGPGGIGVSGAERPSP
ncbi:hypothetical protein K4G93_23405, partial [Mycobacterium tuberculosis]|nr:hypothetical protein [Mycobacterium tuberculosis]